MFKESHSSVIDRGELLDFNGRKECFLNFDLKFYLFQAFASRRNRESNVNRMAAHKEAHRVLNNGVGCHVGDMVSKLPIVHQPGAKGKLLTKKGLLPRRIQEKRWRKNEWKGPTPNRPFAKDF